MSYPPGYPQGSPQWPQPVTGSENVSYRSHGAGAVHTYSHEERRAFTQFINEFLQGDPDLGADLPMNPQSDSLFMVMGKGLLLAKLVNKIKPGVLNEKKLAKGPNPNTFQINQNIAYGIEGCKEIGCVVVNIGPEDIRGAKFSNLQPHLCLALAWQLVRIALLSRVNLNQHPELVVMLEENEDITNFMNVAPEVNLIRWFNFHLRRAGHRRQDGENYLVLLEQIVPNVVPRGSSREPDPQRRADMVCHYANQIGCGNFITPQDIISGNDKLNLAFTAYLFNKYPGLEVLDDNVLQQQALQEAEKIMKEKFDREEQERKLRWAQEEEVRRQQWALEEQQRQMQWSNEENERRAQLQKEEDEMRARLSAEEARLAAQRAAEDDERRRNQQLQEEERRRWEEQKRREEQEREEERRAEEERRRQWEAQQRLLEAQRRDEDEKRRQAEAKLREEERRLQFEAEARAREEEAKRRAEEEERKRVQAWADYNAQQALAAAEEERRRQEAWATYYRQQEDERRRQEEEKEKQRQAALEAERQRLAAEAERQRQEAERQRQAALEAERQRQMALEAERQRQMALEAERQRQAAIEAERQRQMALEAERQRVEEERRRQAAWADYNAKQEAERQRQLLLQQQQQQQALLQQQQAALLAQQQVLFPAFTAHVQSTTVQVVQTKIIPPKFPIPRLVITAVRARRLVRTDRLGKSDPYVVAIHQGRRLKSDFLKSTQDPVWNQDFEFRNVAISDVINISVWDKNTVQKDDFMYRNSLQLVLTGRGEVNVKADDFVNGQEVWFTLQPREYRTDKVHGDVALRFALIYS